MSNELMYIPNDDKQNYPFCKLKLVFETLDTQNNEPTNQNQVPKVDKPTNKKNIKLWGLV